MLKSDEAGVEGGGLGDDGSDEEIFPIFCCRPFSAYYLRRRKTS
jgi:hypothetical protein